MSSSSTSQPPSLLSLSINESALPSSSNNRSASSPHPILSKNIKLIHNCQAPFNYKSGKKKIKYYVLQNLLISL